MDIVSNLDLLSVGVAIAGIALLGFATFFSNLNSITGRTFLFFAIVAIFWNITNYLTLTLANEQQVLWNLRLHIFFSVWYSFGLFQLFYVFPKDKVVFPKWYKFLLLPSVGLVSVVTLLPITFQRILEFSFEQDIIVIENGPGIAVFGAAVGLLIFGAIFLFVKKLFASKDAQFKQMRLVLIGFITTFFLHLVFNFIFPAILENTNYIQFGALYTFPFIALTAYAIVRHKLFDIRAISIGIITFFLAVVTITGVVFAESLSILIFNASEFILVIIFSIWLIRSVTREVKQKEEIEKLAAKLKSANERLKELDQQKSEFLSIASHQLRSPMTAICGYISLILDKEFGAYPEKLRDPLERIDESSRLMINSIEDYLNISRIEQGRMKYDMSGFDITDLTHTVVQEYAPIAKKKELDLTFTGAEKVMVHADIGKIKQVIANLIDNAIKYTPSGSITVKATGFEDKARITITDTGIGIPKEEIGDLFNKFIRAREANKVNTSGTGLGLYVAKQMVEAHDGKVWAESDGKGRGSQFVIEFPIGKKLYKI